MKTKFGPLTADVKKYVEDKQKFYFNFFMYNIHEWWIWIGWYIFKLCSVQRKRAKKNQKRKKKVEKEKEREEIEIEKKIKSSHKKMKVKPNEEDVKRKRALILHLNQFPDELKACKKVHLEKKINWELEDLLKEFHVSMDCKEI